MASLLSALWHFIADTIAFLWFSFIEPPINEPSNAGSDPPAAIRPATSVRVDTARAQVLNTAREDGILVPQIYRRRSGVEVSVNESSSFLTQLEQRTQQVKITLANLEAEKVRIEGMISQLQPVVPHYDALLQAEQAISSANIPIEQASAVPEGTVTQPEQSWESQHEAPQAEHAESSWGS
jgi:hypothetical protein